MEAIVWPGKGADPKGLTPFGFFDGDAQFRLDAPKVADWCAKQLGYPTMDVEMIDLHFYACFEEAIVEYGHQVNQFNIREHMLDLQGRMTTGVDFTGKPIVGSPLPFLSVLAEDYGAEVGAGGGTDWKTGSVDIQPDVSTYDLQALWSDAHENGNRLEIRRIFHDVLPPINRIFGAHGGLGPGGAGLSVPGVSGGGINSFLSEFGFDRLSPAINFVLLPAYEDILRIQAIEFNDQIRRSAFSFELVNNKVRLFPTPTDDFKLYFHYTVREDRLQSGSITLDDVIGDITNVPYQNINYSTLNAVGRRWVYHYALALAKIVLGNIRSKYQTIPIPNSQITLDGNILRQEGAAEKELLITQLRETLAETGRQKQLDKQNANQDNMQKIFRRVPTYIYIG